MNSSPIELLPTEILQKILRDLPINDRFKVERVCKRWKNVSTEAIWRDVEVLIIHQVSGEYSLSCLTSSEFHELHKSCLQNYDKNSIDCTGLRMLRSLVIRAGLHIKEFVYDSYRDIYSEHVFSIIAKHCHNIESIHLKSVNDTDLDVFLRLLENNKQLNSITCCWYSCNVVDVLPLRDWKSLNFASIVCFDSPMFWTDHGSFSENKIIDLIESSPSLEKLGIHMCTLDIITAISECEKLKDLFFVIEDEAVTKDFMTHTSLLNRLSCLKIARFCGYEIGDNLVNLLRHCINLKTLHLLFTNYELSNAVQEAVLALPNLESVNFETCRLTDDFLGRLVNFKNLRVRQDDIKITANGIFEMVRKSKCIEILEITGINVIAKLCERLAEYARKRRIFLIMRVDTIDMMETQRICENSGIYVFRDSNDFLREIQRW